MPSDNPLGPPPPPPPSESDIRLKTDIRQVGTTAHNLPLYAFRYIGKDTQYEGVMAQDVLKVMPTAVSVGEDGYYRVNYEMLGIELREIARISTVDEERSQPPQERAGKGRGS